jgi:hypothetical protein
MAIMKTIHLILGAASWLLLVQFTQAATHYVDANGTNPVPPYTGWSTAATNIQDAIDAATNGDLVLVTNGVYAAGGRVVYGSLTNRVVIDKAVTVQSVNGPEVTAIEGGQVPGIINGDSAVRCVYLTNNAALIGFTLTNGATRSMSVGDSIREKSGGGIFCENGSGLVSNCVIVGNSCYWYGAGAYGGSYDHCQFFSNTNLNISPGGGGGGAACSALNHCCLSGNWASYGGGAFSSWATNCELSGNSGDGAYACILDHCLIFANQGNGAYLFSGGGASLSTLNDCTIANNINTNVNGYGGGAFDCVLNNCTVSNNLAIRGGGVYYEFHQTNSPGQNNVVVGNTAIYDGGGIWLGVGVANTNWSLSNWSFTSNTAAHDGGGLFLSGSPRSKLDHCTFQGNIAGDNGGGFCGNFPDLTPASDCSFVGNSTTANGGGAYSVMLINSSVAGNRAGNGGGVYGSISNCLINGNLATTNGGGVFVFQSGLQGSCTFSVVTNNKAANGGGVYSTSQVLSRNCIVSGNVAATNGGGIYGGALKDCLITGNSAQYGGGGYHATLYNCTVVGNSAGMSGGGLYLWSSLANTIVYYNDAPSSSNYFPIFTATSCCTVPVPPGTGNITNAPAFIALATGNYRLQTNSPCIDTGNNSYFLAGDVDADGRARIVSSSIDIGAYEFQGSGTGEFIGWLQQFGLPTDGSDDHADTDTDGMNNYAEWKTSTNPTNALSLLQLAAPAFTHNPEGIVVTWQSVANVVYDLQRSSDLADDFTPLQNGLIGQDGAISYTDTTATNGGPYFYRVGVQ